jgi:hypothetical protein
MPQACARPALIALNVGWLVVAKAERTPPTPRPPPRSSQQAATNAPIRLVRLLAAMRRIPVSGQPV